MNSKSSENETFLIKSILANWIDNWTGKLMILDTVADEKMKRFWLKKKDLERYE